MSEDEVFVTLFSCVGAAAWWLFAWLAPVLAVRHNRSTGNLRAMTAVTAIGCLVLLFVILAAWASHDVRNAPQYLFQYTAMGVCAVGICTLTMGSLLGISMRDDVIERGNPAATWAVCGAMLGFTLAFAGANIGDGPGWWVVVFASMLSCGTLLAVWLLFELVFSLSWRITVERDTATGVRLAGLLVAVGFAGARGAAGNWVSAGATVRDFVDVMWAPLAVVLPAGAAEYIFAPSPQHPVRSVVPWGIGPAAVYVALSVAHVLMFKPW